MMTSRFGRKAPLTVSTVFDPDAVERYHATRIEPVSEPDRACAWTAYFTLVYAAIVSFIPETAAAAIVKVATIIG